MRIAILCMLLSCLLLLAVVFLPTSAHQGHKRHDERYTGRPGYQGHPLKKPKPEFIGPIGNHSFRIGRDGILTCPFHNIGNHNVNWIRLTDDLVLTVNDRTMTGKNHHKAGYFTSNHWQLHIGPLLPEDMGCYACQIITKPDLMQQIGCIDVHVPPDIISDEAPSEVTVQELENASLSCKATGHPKPKITWRREDHEPILIRKPNSRDFEKVDKFVGNPLQLHRVDRRQMGIFLCIASNEVPPAVSKRIKLLVNFAPAVKVPNQLLGAPLGTDVKLKCYMEAFPSTINYWVKNRQEMLLDGPKFTIQEEKVAYKISMWLTIKDFSRSDIGTYNCVSTNSMGRSEGTLRLYEIKLGSEDEELNNNEITVEGLMESAKGYSNAIKLTLFSKLFCMYLATLFIFV